MCGPQCIGTVRRISGTTVWPMVIAAAALHPGFVDDPTPAHANPLRFQQPQPLIRSNGKGMHVEICVLAIGCTHDRGRRRYDLESPALPNPVNMPMAMHDHDVICQVLQSTDEPNCR